MLHLVLFIYATNWCLFADLHDLFCSMLFSFILLPLSFVESHSYSSQMYDVAYYCTIFVALFWSFLSNTVSSQIIVYFLIHIYHYLILLIFSYFLTFKLKMYCFVTVCFIFGAENNMGYISCSYLLAEKSMELWMIHCYGVDSGNNHLTYMCRE